MPSGPAQPLPEPRWSPFPVQDWSTLPFDPLAPAGPVGTARPVRPRPWWLPPSALALVGVLVAVLAALGTAPAATAAAADAYLPADGVSQSETTETTTGDRTRSRSGVSEQARFAGAAGVLGLDDAFSRRLVGLAAATPGLQLLRTTSTPLDGRPQTTRLYRTDDGVRLLGESGPDGALVLTPGLLELPADVAAGRRWVSEGTVDTGGRYRSELAAQAGDAGCLAVSGRLEITRPQGTRARTLSRTWCPGRGLVASSTESDGTRAVTTAAALTLPVPTTQDRPVTWTDPATWTSRALATRSVDPTLGAGPALGGLAQVAPVRTAAGTVVRVLAAQRDLVGTRPDGEGWRTVWRVHPGGPVLGVAAFGDVVLVTTGERRLVAYSDAGVRLWTAELAELAPLAPTRLDDDRVVLAGLDGIVRTFGLADGAPGWSHSLDADVTVAPAVGRGLVVVADRSGTTTALDAGTGAVRWSTPLLGTALTVTADGTVVVLQDQSAHGLRPGDGRHRWLRPFTGTAHALQPLGDGVLLATGTASLRLDADGVVTARRAPFLAVTAAAGRVVGWGVDQATVLDADATVLARWPLPAEATVFSDRPAVAVPEGVLLATQTWDLVGWTA